jgi:hypothetical protein
MRSVYSALLSLYPRAWRETFAAEMLAVFDQAASDRRSEGVWAYLAFAAAEMLGVVKGACLARLGREARPEPAAVTLDARIRLLIDRTVHAIATHDFETARRCAREEEALRARQRQDS